MMLTKSSLKLIAIFISCLLIGLILGNHIIAIMSLVPLSLILIGVIFESPKNLTILKQWNSSRVWVGDVLEIKYEVTVNSGLGFISLFQELPTHFALAEGNNFSVFWKGWHVKTFTFSCKICCTKRGSYNLPPVKWESNQVLRLTETLEGDSGKSIEIQVRPKILNVRRVRNLTSIAAVPYPVNDIARIGVATTDFREIRNYVYGDPIKNINWKATARNSNQQSWPLVNEFEVEGKKAVWLFLDTSRELMIGTNIKNSFEYCLEATNAITFFYIEHGYRIGMYIFNGRDQLFYPDAGKKQFLKISQELLDVKPGEQSGEFPTAIEKCRQYILGYNPLNIIVTKLDSPHADTIITGVKKLRQMLGTRRRKLPVMVINIAGYNLISKREEYDKNACLLMQLKTHPRIHELHQIGASVLDWNPSKESFAIALLKHVKSR
jgi:uncharacterized protein (DUF58 family)